MTTKSSIDDQFITKLTQIINENLHDEDFGAAELAVQLGMSRITLYRKVKAVVKKSVSEFIRETRLKRACQLLCEKAGTVSEIAYNVGFKNPAYFNKCFHEYYDCTPGDVLKGNHVNIKLDNEEEEKSHKSVIIGVPVIYLVILIVLIISSGLFLYFNYFNTPTIDVDDFYIMVIPPFNDESPKAGNSKAKLVRLELHNKLNLSQLKVKDKSITDDSTFLKIGYQKLVDSLKADYVLMCDRSYTDGEARYFFRLLDKDGSIMWREDFLENEKSANEFASNIADFVISELDIKLTAEEEKQIKELPSKSPAAIRVYEDGLKLIQLSRSTLEDKKRAIKLFETAIKFDSTYAEAYFRLGGLYSFSLPKEEQDISKAIQYFLKAVKYKHDNAWYWDRLASSYETVGNKEAADSCRNIAKQFSTHGKHGKMYYATKAYQYDQRGQHYEAIRYALMYYKMNEGTGEINIPHTLNETWINLSLMGFPEVAKKYLHMMLESYGVIDTTKFSYYYYLSIDYGLSRKYDKSKEYFLKLHDKLVSDTLVIKKKNRFKMNKYIESLIGLLEYELLQENVEKYDHYIQKIDSVRKAWNFELKPDLLNIGYAFACLETGKKEKAMFVLEGVIKQHKKEIEQNAHFAKYYISHMHLALIYAYLDERDKSLEYLTAVKNAETDVGYHRKVMDYPVFQKFMKDKEYKKVYNELIDQYNTEHKKIAKLLKKEGLLVS